MARIQAQFEKFHSIIRIDYKMSKELAEKRDIVLEKIRKYLQDNDKPGFTPLLQGSYAMKTGVKPLGDCEYDLDVGLRFDIDPDDYSTTEVRSWVKDAVDGHTRRIEEKGPCLRVCYEKGYHLDLVCYAVCEKDGQEQFRLAHKTKGWRDSDPPALLEHVREARRPYKDLTDTSTQTDQFRRTVRFVRRWDDVAVDCTETSKLSGLAFTLLCSEKLNPTSFVNATSDDARALRNLANIAGNLSGRIVATKPTPEHEDMFAVLTDVQVTRLKARFLELADALDEAESEPDPVEACLKLQDLFGSDFPVPDPEDTAKKTAAPAIITSSSSA